MARTRDAAREYVRAFAGTDTSPALTPAELELVLDSCRIVDAAGRLITDALYVETIWATRAVVAALDLKLAKVSGKTDLTVDGATIHSSQVGDNLRAQRRSWRSRMLPGSA